MTITDWPVDERPREKLLNRGATSLSDAELMAIFLRTGISGKTAVDIARDLLRQFGSLRATLNATQNEFCQAHGMGPAKYVQLQATLEIGRRYLFEELKKENPLTSPNATRRYLLSCLRDKTQETFVALFLDTQHHILCVEELSSGTIDSATIYPREVLKRCLALNSAAVIFAHNHPSGIAEPSQADELITRRLQKALGLVDIKVLDHLIIGEGEVISFAERGLI